MGVAERFDISTAAGLRIEATQATGPLPSLAIDLLAV
jgi:hypothetical protein